MSGLYFCQGKCWACGLYFSFNPERVPSFEGEPICGDCMELVNRVRTEQGLEAYPILSGAYEPSEHLG